MNLLYYLLFFAFILVGCSDDISTTMAPDNYTDNSELFLLTEREGVERAIQAYGDFFEESSTVCSRNVRGCKIRLYTNAKSRSESVINPLYIVNFDDGGFSIVSALRDAQCVPYAVSKTGVFEETNNEPLQAFLEDVSSTPAFKGGPIKRDSLENSTDLPLLPPGNWRPLGLNSDTLINEVCESKKFEIGMVTKWDQGFPFNMYAPNAIAGCVPIAIGQICAFNQFPNEVNGFEIEWPEIITTPKASLLSGVYQFQLADFTREVSNMLDIKYGEKYSTSNINDAKRVLNELGYKDASISGLLDDCINSVFDSIPVYIRADNNNLNIGHAWVVDGAHDSFMEERYFDRKTLKEICLTWSCHYKYLQFNWGLGGTDDGYYMAYSKTYSRESGWREKEYNFYISERRDDGAKIDFSENRLFIVDLYPTK